MHLSILCGTAKPAVKRCTTCCKRFHCPLCPKFKPCAPSRLEKHLEVHLKNGIMFKDMAIYKCHLTCRDVAHFHCPQCAKTILRRGDMESINPGPWKETTGLEIEGFPRQLYGNDCGIFMLMYALYTILDAPYDFTIIDMPNFDLGNHGKMFAHWTETSKALLRGEGPPVFRVRKRKLDDITEKEEQLQPHPADVSVGKDVEKTMEAPTSKIVQDCKKAAEWVVAHKHLCTRVHLPDAVSMGEAQLREAVKLWEETPDERDEDEMEASWSHSSLGLNIWKTCGPS
ncbi:TRMT1-like protein [Dissostichus eleginoides]|uniref:TRMT1-like protein n=1 Tax=Dissostichus eleginoides TaxID=100907 RepID=A0AAD9CMA6_DISEL|nr:TRMT1-like protein [Dissostichus eleginoides]